MTSQERAALRKKCRNCYMAGVSQRDLSRVLDALDAKDARIAELERRYAEESRRRREGERSRP